MDPRPATTQEKAYWTDRDGQPVMHYVLGGPEEGDGVIPCPTLIGIEAPAQCHVAYQLNEIELAALAQGGTLWLTTWGLLPVHLLEVVPSDSAYLGANPDDQPCPIGPGALSQARESNALTDISTQHTKEQ